MAYCAVLRCYGKHLFSSGEPLCKWRHLCAFSLLGFGSPVGGALPSYTPDSDAVCFGQGYNDTAVVGLAFYGVARVGEPLLARRGTILLPRDFLLSELDTCYVRVEAPKTRFRFQAALGLSVDCFGRAEGLKGYTWWLVWGRCCASLPTPTERPCPRLDVAHEAEIAEHLGELFAGGCGDKCVAFASCSGSSEDFGCCFSFRDPPGAPSA